MRPFTLITSVLLVLVLSFTALAAKEKTPQAGLTPAEEAGMRLLAMQDKGLIKMRVGEPITYILVEPQNWKDLKPEKKEELARLALTLCHGFNQKGKKIDFVIIRDMTSRETLGRVFIKNGRIEILK
ncbi:MAG: hypothetical protein P8X65_01265 [Syntrophobacterales bacterium]|jgi:hypothetical protein